MVSPSADHENEPDCAALIAYDTAFAAAPDAAAHASDPAPAVTASHPAKTAIPVTAPPIAAAFCIAKCAVTDAALCTCRPTHTPAPATARACDFTAATT